MHIELKGRKVIVAGPTAGIGRAIAEGLARAVASVVVNGRTQERVDTARREMRALLPQAEQHGVAADITTPEGCAAMIAQAPDADVLINNAGTARPNNFFDQTDEEWLDLFHLNVLSGVRLARRYLPKMTARGWGRVVFASSESGQTGVRLPIPSLPTDRHPCLEPGTRQPLASSFGSRRSARRYGRTPLVS